MKVFRIFCPHCNRAAFTLQPTESAPLLDDPMMVSDGRHRSVNVDPAPDKVGARRIDTTERHILGWWVDSSDRAPTPGQVECVDTGKWFEIRVEPIRQAWQAFRKGGRTPKMVGEPVDRQWLSNPSRDW